MGKFPNFLLVGGCVEQTGYDSLLFLPVGWGVLPIPMSLGGCLVQGGLLKKRMARQSQSAIVNDLWVQQVEKPGLADGDQPFFDGVFHQFYPVV